MRNIVNDEKGYTLVESIFQLIVLVLLLQFIILLFYWKSSIDKQLGTQAFRDLELFSLELQQLLESVDEVDVQNHRRRLQIKKETTYTFVELSGFVIRQRSIRGGHIPLFTQVRDVQFFINDNELAVKLVITSGEELERTFVIGAAS